MGAHAGTKHSVPAPESLFPERLAPRKYPVFDHSFIAAPNVVYENLDLACPPGYAFERGDHVCIHAVVASNTRHVFFVGYTIVGGPAGHENPRPAFSKDACDPAADAI